MRYKDLLVVLDPWLQARGRIELAAALAERFAAFLVGLYPLPVLLPPRELGYFDPAMRYGCGALLIGRDWFDLTRWHLAGDGRCLDCGTPLPGVFEPRPGSWGRQRRPVPLCRQ